jgi:hypothetical protein
MSWLINQLPPLSIKIHPCHLQKKLFTGISTVQVVTRSALDWETLADQVPEENGPIIRWSGPTVEPPPERVEWVSRRLRVHYDRFSQEFIWWGPQSLFHVKQNHWNSAENYSVHLQE